MNNSFFDGEKDLNNSINNDLLRSFIGKNYDKITTKPFNFAGFFFTTGYMFYRKMFLYGILWFIINLIIINLIEQSKQFFVTLILNIVVGFFVNKLYLYYANKKISKIKLKNSQKEFNELKEICASKGGTSLGKVFLGFVTEIAIAIVILVMMFLCGMGVAIASVFNLDNWNITINNNQNDINNFDSTNNKIFLEDVTFSGGNITIGSKSYFYVNGTGNYVSNDKRIKSLIDYMEYIKLDIYYVENNEERVIVDYKVYLKSNNEDITNINNEDELRIKIGLYSTGIHTETFTFLENAGGGSEGYMDEQRYYLAYVFVDSRNNEYKMKYFCEYEDYINMYIDNKLGFIANNKYTITFEVVKDEIWGKYEYYIKSFN